MKEAKYESRQLVENNALAVADKRHTTNPIMHLLNDNSDSVLVKPIIIALVKIDKIMILRLFSLMQY